MDLKEIRNELRKLSETVDGWSDLSGAPALERDWALEKLRTIYEVLRFGGERTTAPAEGAQPAAKQPSAASPVLERPQPDEAAPAVADAVSETVDLSEVLSLDKDDEAAAAEPVAPGEVGSMVRGGVGASGEVPAGPASAREADVDPALKIIDLAAVAEEEEYPAAASGQVPEEEAPHERTSTVVRQDIAPVEEPQPEKPHSAAVRYPEGEPHSAAVRHPEGEARSAVKQPTGDTHSVSAASPEPMSAQQFEPATSESAASEPAVPESAVPESLSESSAASETPAPTLFGPDDPKELHRRKQRVIMSLYDTAPADPEIVLLDAYTEEPIEESRPERAAAVPQQNDAGEPESAPEVGARFSSAGPQDEPEQAPLDIEVLQEDFPVSAPASVPTSASASSGAVLGEVINHDVRTLADTIVSPGYGRYGEPIADLRQAIGINDKFLMIRDLFGGDSALFETTIAALNAQPGLDDCMIYIAEHFAWNPDSESAKLIMELLERKFA